MNAEHLLAHYERIADAPGAIARMRQFVLDLAVRGKLVPQDSDDKPAADALKRIANEKSRLVNANIIRKRIEHLGSYPINSPSLLPNGWSWARIDELSPLSLVDGDWIETKDQAEDGGVRLVQLADVGVGRFINRSARFVTAETEARLNCTRLAVGDVLIARLPNPIGRACIFPDIGQPAITAVDVAILRLDRNISREYIVIAINAPPTREQIEAYGKGATRFRVSTGHLKTVLLPLPPRAEQHRIVAKVDELMALCDRLEAARAEREATRDRLTAASLARLNTPDPDPATFATHTPFALDHLPALTARPDQIKLLRQTILNLAVSGRLGDNVAGSVVRVGDFRKLQNGYAFKSEWFSNTGVRLLRNTNIGHGKIHWSDTQCIPECRLAEFERFELRLNDIVLTLDRPFIATGTKFARVTNADLPSLLLQRVGRFIEITDGLADDYLFIWINSPHFEDQINPGRSNGVPHISSKQVEAAQIFVPSITEQHRIVAKVHTLVALCDALERSLVEGEATRHRLLDALLAEALEPHGEARAAQQEAQIDDAA